MSANDPSGATAASLDSLTHALHLSEERYRLLVDAVSDYAIFLLDANGIVSSWNRGARIINGYSADEIIGCHFSRFYPQDSIELGWPEHELRQAKAVGRFEDEGWRLRKDGSRFWANVVITALYDEQGELWGYSKITRDLTERKQQEESLRKSEERFRILVEGVKDCAIFLLNPQGIVSSWNSGAQNIKGYAADEIIGRHFSQFYAAEEIERGWPEHELKVARAEGSFEDEGWRIRKDGTRFWANVLITALHDANGQLYGFAKVTRDMTTRRRLEALELAEQRMNEFLAMLSHELRNPLAPIRSALTAMQAAALEDAVQERSRSVIDRQVSHIARLVDDLMDASRVTVGNINIVRDPVDLRDVVEAAVESVAPLIQKRGHQLEQGLPQQPVYVQGDTVRLTQVVQNLLNNAAQYTEPGGRIRVIVDTDTGGAGDHSARIRVSDTGRGISADRLEDVFHLFIQDERSLDRSEGGLGLGLTLARRLVELHGGSVIASSGGLGKGSEFCVSLPLSAAPPAVTTPAPAAPAEVKGGESLRVMVVEDLLDVAEGVEMVLELWGHQVKVVHDGTRALELAPEFQPDAVILDIGLPGMNGYEVAQHLRKIPTLRHAKIIALTGYGQDSDRERALASGFDHHLVKGSSLQKLKVLLSPQT